MDSSDSPNRATILAVLTRTSKLFATWSLATLLALLGIATVFTLCLGRSNLVSSQSIYEGHYKVGRSGTVEWYTREGRGQTHFGDDGLVVKKELDLERTRLLFVGDSFVQGRGVVDRDKFTEIVERRWNLSHTEQIQTLNVGLGGLSMAAYVYFAENLDRTFKPDLVFVWITAADFENTAQFERELERLKQPARPNPAAPALDLLNDAGYYAFLRQLIKQTQGILDNKGFGSLTPKAQSGAQRTDQMPAPDPAHVATQLDQIKRQWGPRLVIIYHSFAPGIGRYSDAECQDRVWQEIQNQGMDAINLCPSFCQAFEARTPPTGFDNSILGRGHLNARGQTLVATEVLEFLEARDGFH